MHLVLLYHAFLVNDVSKEKAIGLAKNCSLVKKKSYVNKTISFIVSKTFKNENKR